MRRCPPLRQAGRPGHPPATMPSTSAFTPVPVTTLWYHAIHNGAGKQAREVQKKRGPDRLIKNVYYGVHPCYISFVPRPPVLRMYSACTCSVGVLVGEQIRMHPQPHFFPIFFSFRLFVRSSYLVLFVSATLTRCHIHAHPIPSEPECMHIHTYTHVQDTNSSQR